MFIAAKRSGVYVYSFKEIYSVNKLIDYFFSSGLLKRTDYSGKLPDEL